MSSSEAVGLVSIPSHHTVDETIARLTEILAAKGAKVFAIIDHSGEAEKVGLTMAPTKVVIFGNPRGGTPLMVAAPSIAIDLPLKLLIAEEAQGVVKITWNAPEYLGERHHLPEAMQDNIAVVAALAKLAAGVVHA